MAQVLVYSALVCPYCIRAKELLDSKGASYEEVRIDQNPAKMEEMLTRSGGRKTVPQIFINNQHVGGFDDLKALNDAGKLDEMLQTKGD